ncbi:hypothetical protein GDO86_020329 [Hymenochirus boettgeri]|uniref:Bcl-2 Bcl-2 homology region 1-3 domain-containing protein n=1 Tax=Hymenochirus boettgeri TaxID=247094 RepID=A0A8T2IC76_9PIPI|nr:hypothetical protein GDO86_020329 [Hymenochirus boettgeri]
MINSSMISMQRKTTGMLLPYQLYCAGGGRGYSPDKSQLSVTARPHSLRVMDGGDTAERPQPVGFVHTDGGSLSSSQGNELDDEVDDEDLTVSRGSTSPPDTPICPKDSLYLETQQLLLAFFREYSEGESGGFKAAILVPHGRQQRALETLRRVGGEIIEKHKMVFDGMLQRLSIHRPEDLQKLSDVPAMVFNDGNTNWGRVVTLISFGAFVAKDLKSKHLEDCIASLAENFTEFLMTDRKEWIIQEKGWEGFVDFFHIEDYESGLKTVLMAFSSVAFLGAGLAFMIR